MLLYSELQFKLCMCQSVLWNGMFSFNININKITKVSCNESSQHSSL